MNYDKIGSFIQQKRKDKNLTQKQLAEKIGVTDRAISKWERGQGCPDVSILEVLSKELGCSILELLKGRKIENEVIPVTEADDYVRDSMNISKQVTKEKIISLFNKSIVASIIFIFVLLLYFNIVQIIYVNKEYTLSIDKETYKRVTEIVDSINNNLNIIEQYKGIYMEDDYDKIVENLHSCLDNIKNEKTYYYVLERKDIKYTVNDIFTYLETDEIISAQLDTTRILDKYSDDDLTSYYRDVITSGFLVSAYSADEFVTFTSYQYRINPFIDDNEFYHVENRELRHEIYKLENKLAQLEYMTELVIEVGDIHE